MAALTRPRLLAFSQKKDWLSLVAVHSDTWLLAVAFYNGARLNREGRERLFELINEQPTCYEVVSGRVSRDVARPKKRGAPGQPARPAGLGAPAKNPRPVIFFLVFVLRSCISLSGPACQSAWHVAVELDKLACEPR